MSHYCYQCFDCNTVLSAEEVETNLIYLCPKCGACETNMPLKGVLLVKYDYKHISSVMPKEKLYACRPGAFWDYSELQPLRKNVDARVKRIFLNGNPVQYRDFGSNKLFIFDDTVNPTLSYKDRATSLVVVKALEMGISEIAAASTGNAGSSLAGIGARMGITTHLFCPARIPTGKRLQIQSFGAKLYLVDGSYDDAFDLSLAISGQKRWYNRNTAYNPLTIEGKKSSVFDMFTCLQGNLPDIIFVPVGDGVIIGGIYKGLYDLWNCGYISKLPKLIAVQAEGSDAVCRFLETGKYEFVPAETLADSISAGAPRNLFMAADAVNKTGGIALRVSDNEIFDAQKTAAREFGMLIEPAAAASMAGYIKYIQNYSLNGQSCMVMFTGNGLKDLAALQRWNDEPIKRGFKEWNDYFSAQ